MSRWDGKVWQSFKKGDLGAKTSYAISDFVLDGEEVWASTEEGVAHWDGRYWRLYKEAAARFDASIAAVGGQVWIIDRTGKLSHFEGGRWQSQKLNIPAVNKADNSDDEDLPRLARTSNGVVWLAWHGIWRLDGIQAVRVADGQEHLKDAHWVGAAGDRLWWSDSAGLQSLAMDGKRWTVYPSAQTGLEHAGMVRDVASAGGSTWFATWEGLLEYDGSHWHRLPLPSQTIIGVAEVAAAPNGELWAVGIWSPRSQLVYRYFVRIAGLLSLAIVGAVIWTFQRLRRRQLYQHQLVAQAVQHATGDIPEELQHGEKRLKWRGGIVTMVMIFGTGVAFFFVRRVWPQAPLWLIPVIAISIHLAETFLQALVKRKPKPSDPIGPGAPSLYNWGNAWKAVAGTVLIIAVVNADRLPMLKFLRGYMLWIILLAPVGYNMLMARLLNAAASRADYEGALKIIRWFHFYNPTGVEPLRMSGHILLLAGRYREAEDTLRRSLVSSQARQSYGHALEYLGDALMEQGRYDEAMRSYEAALHAFAWRRRPYRGMAEMLLRRGNNPQQALEYVEKIVDFTGLSVVQRNGNGRPQDDYWALKAWALAAIGRTSEVGAAIESALKATSAKCMPDLATTHYRIGMAMQVMGNRSAANEHFQRAIDLDPNGRRGILSKAAMHEPAMLRAV